jgi:hypothetical protein
MVLYIKTYQPVFAYQSTGSGINGANQNMFFCPPIKLVTPTEVNNIFQLNLSGVLVSLMQQIKYCN